MNLLVILLAFITPISMAAGYQADRHTGTYIARQLSTAGVHADVIQPYKSIIIADNLLETIKMIANQTQKGTLGLNVLSKEEISIKYASAKPKQWGDTLPGCIKKLDTDEKVVAFTFDACGGGLKGKEYDEKLIDFLIKEQIPASLFLTGKWIKSNPESFEYICRQSNFHIENHGETHKPLSVTGRSQYGIRGTKDPEEIYDEIVPNNERIYAKAGRRPLFIRAGTAFYDDVAIDIANDLCMEVAGYTITGDAGATYSKNKILSVTKNPENGAIFLFHMNHPEGNTAEGFIAAYKQLKQDGYNFVFLEEYFGR